MLFGAHTGGKGNWRFGLVAMVVGEKKMACRLPSQSWDQTTRIALPKFQKFQYTSQIAYTNGFSMLNAYDLATFLPTVLLQQMYYRDPIIRNTVPLVLSLVSTSNPVFHILGTLQIQPRQRRPNCPQRRLRNGPWSGQHERLPARVDAVSSWSAGPGAYV